GVVLSLGGAGYGDSGGGVGGVGEAGAVVAGVAVAAPGVGFAELRAGVVDCGESGGCGCRGVYAVHGGGGGGGADGVFQGVCELSGGLFVLGVGVGVCGAFDGLRGVVDGHLLPAGDCEEVAVELCGGVGGVHDLGGGAPALGGALLEEAEAVAVAVIQVVQPGFLQGGGDGYNPAAFGNVELLAARADGGGV